MVCRRSRRSSDAAWAAFALFALIVPACIQVGQIAAPIDDKSTTMAPDAATDGGPSPDAATGSGRPGDHCSANQDCAQGACVDGVCCQHGSCPLCQFCGEGGNCLNVSFEMLDPHARCYPIDPPQSCGRSGACNGAGACAYYPLNTECAKGTCDGDSVVGASACDGVGHCKQAPTKICVPFLCDPSTDDCVANCTDSSQCVAGQTCVNGSCGMKMKGATCKLDADCASNFCADGVCCNVACQGPCISCNLRGREGTCWPVDAGTPDPRNICIPTDPTSCGPVGACDGSGDCLLYDATTVCARTCAADGSALTTVQCDGAGNCGPAVEISMCATNICDASLPTCQ